jgi:hypothetical protein
VAGGRPCGPRCSRILGWSADRDRQRGPPRPSATPWRAIQLGPGLQTAEIAERLGQKVRAGQEPPLAVGRPGDGPFHPHYRRGSGKYAPKFYFPGRCSGTCPGPAARRLNPGDLNDEPEAATTQILYGPPGSEIGTGGFNQPDQGDGQRLWNLAARIPEPERYSRIYRGRRELIDHILASQPPGHPRRRRRRRHHRPRARIDRRQPKRTPRRTRI